MKKSALIALMCPIFFITACGGGGLSSGIQQTRAVIAFSLISTSKLPFRISGVEMTASLPTGLTVASTGAEITSGLVAGSAVTGLLLTSNYVTPTVKIMIADNTQAQAGFGPGEMALLTCLIPDGITVSESDRFALENKITSSFKASGWDPAAPTNPVSLKTYLQPKISVTLTR